MTPRRVQAEHAALASTGGLLIAFLGVPMLALIVTMPPADFYAGLQHALVWPALRLSIVTTAVALFTTLLFGTPLAWTFARSTGRFAHALEIAVQVPVVLPPAVAGIALLLAFGRRGFLTALGITSTLSFTTTAVIMAQTFVAAPLFVQAATSAFRQIDPKIWVVARSVGASPIRIFIRLAVPTAARGLVAGAAMSWARSLGEFGATLMFAGSLEGRTQTLPLAIYAALETDMRAAQALSILLLLISFVTLAGVKATLVRKGSYAR
jgi:molybdate transport system permease protein